MDLTFLKDCQVDVAAPYTAAGTSTITSSVFDMQGYDACAFIAVTGDGTSGTVLTLTPKENAANSTSSPTPTAISSGDCTVTSASATDVDNKIMVSDCIRPVKRYVFCTLARATQNCEVACILIVRYRAKNKPVTQAAVVIASALSTPEA